MPRAYVYNFMYYQGFTKIKKLKNLCIQICEIYIQYK